MSYFVLIYLVVILFGFFVLGYAFWAKANVAKKKKLLSLDNFVIEEKVETKTKQRIEIETLLIQNNYWTKFFYTLDKNVRIKFLAITLVSGIIYLFNRDVSSTDLAMIVMGILVTFIFIPSFACNFLIRRQIKKIMEDMPGFIDLVAVNLQVGIALEAAMKQVGEDFATLNKDLSLLILRVIRKSEVIGLEAAITELSISLPTTEVKMFCTVLLQSLNFGSSIYHHLIQLSADIRDIQLLAIEEKLGSLAAKMSVPLILLIMFPIVILIVAPGAMRILPTLL
ncbi:pilus assembly protein TadC [Pasteurellaceae bacterium 15-036681]|nr:pilus assembly protein TadC [Pasteurellaceae bacterium 15-036681]